MKIILVHNRYLHRGGEDLCHEAEMQLLRDQGHEVMVYEESNTRVAELGSLRMSGRTVWSRESYAKVTETIRAVRPDIMHVHNFFPLISPSIYYAAYRQRVPVVQTLHNYRLFCLNAYFLRDQRVCEDCLGRRFPWPGVRHACYRDNRGASAVVAGMLMTHRLLGTWTRRVTRYIALTAFARDKFVEGGLPANRIAIKPNFIGTDPGVGREERTGAIYVGRLSAEKGIHTLLDGWEQSGVPGPLRIVGAGPEMAIVADRARNNPALEVLGSLDYEAVFAAIKKSRVLIFPSLLYETFGRTIIEAFATGTPVVAARLGAAAELVEEGKHGALFAPGDATDLARVLCQVMADPQRLATMCACARRVFEAKYTADTNYELLMEIYREAMGE